MIRTFETEFPNLTLEAFIEHQIGHVPALTLPESISATINAGGWIVACPWCPGALMASDNDPRFFCVTCENAARDGKWVGVTWPEARTAIEALLSLRPDPFTRYWTTESVVDLERENAEHGIGGKVVPQIRRVSVEEAAVILAHRLPAAKLPGALLALQDAAAPHRLEN